MVVLGYKEFMEEARIRLENLSSENLLKLILNWASEEHPSKRQEFLDKLILPKQEKDAVLDVETLLEEIESFAQRVDDGEYCDGWGWDDDIHEERDWGGESWAEEMDDFFLEARRILLQEQFKTAEEVYRRLFDILKMGQEPGHLPGDPDFRNQLKVDMDEHVALFLRSVYMNTPTEERSVSLYKSMNEYRYMASRIKFKNIINALDSVLPDLNLFLAEWIEFLKDQRQMGASESYFTSELLREAVFLKGGISAISEFARQYGDKFPRAYIDWITALEMEEDIDLVLKVAREGLSRIPRDYTIRAEVAETISRIGEKLKDDKLKLEAYRECMYSKPSMEYLLDLYYAAIECCCFEEIRDEAEQRIMELRGKSRVPDNNYYGNERNTSYASEAVLINALLLGGRYEKVFEMCKGKGPLGWSSSDNPKPLFVTFMMTILSKEGSYAKILSKQWDDTIGNTGYYPSKEYIEKYRKIVGLMIESIKLTSEQEELFMKWCMNAIEGRIVAIVSNQYRGSYHKAAGLLVAMAETLANRGKKQEGMDLVERYRSKYPRHTAFRREVTQAVQISSLFG
ncbi:MAG: hypothetical protein Q7J85_09635 [Bacillota bacterium]|nr:hypothetical protein [Bacillota bacterium]